MAWRRPLLPLPVPRGPRRRQLCTLRGCWRAGRGAWSHWHPAGQRVVGMQASVWWAFIRRASDEAAIAPLQPPAPTCADSAQAGCCTGQARQTHPRPAQPPIRRLSPPLRLLTTAAPTASAAPCRPWRPSSCCLGWATPCPAACWWSTALPAASTPSSCAQSEPPLAHGPPTLASPLHASPLWWFPCCAFLGGEHPPDPVLLCASLSPSPPYPRRNSSNQPGCRCRSPTCIACGSTPTITAANLPSYDYAAFTGQAAANDAAPKPLQLIAREDRITPQELQQRCVGWLAPGAWCLALYSTA